MGLIEDKARSVAEPFLKANDCVLWDVIFEKEGAMNYLKILFDDKTCSLDMEKCEALTPPLNKLMDTQEFIKQVDILEIGSPGITRRLRREEHFDFALDKRVKVSRRLDDGKTQVVSGILNGFDKENKTVTVDGEEISLKRVLRINLEDNERETS